jgi:hypothetical protein
MTLTVKGQVTVRIRRADEQARGDALVAHLRDVGRRAPGPRLSTDQILALTRRD